MGKIIDFEKKGNLVRFFIGDDDENEYWGDDWDDRPYEHNAGSVYDRYIIDTTDVVFPFDYTVLEPSEDWKVSGNSEWSKEDMKNRNVPCIIAIKDPENRYTDCFSDAAVGDYKDMLKFYFGDEIRTSDEILSCSLL